MVLRDEGYMSYPCVVRRGIGEGMAEQCGVVQCAAKQANVSN